MFAKISHLKHPLRWVVGAYGLTVLLALTGIIWPGNALLALAVLLWPLVVMVPAAVVWNRIVMGVVRTIFPAHEFKEGEIVFGTFAGGSLGLVWAYANIFPAWKTEPAVFLAALLMVMGAAMVTMLVVLGLCALLGWLGFGPKKS